ncbi:hypothetical protein RRG08_009880 [Elysia crispata]|uniref:Uncharacterized protein n=1 Tax=Elysia crispata TaxID=231223 RepID=A0AAE0Z5W2_9GAST|nr:hypothetical protein RRG08_009880 [Elysia crispata]
MNKIRVKLIGQRSELRRAVPTKIIESISPKGKALRIRRGVWYGGGNSVIVGGWDKSQPICYKTPHGGCPEHLFDAGMTAPYDGSISANGYNIPKPGGYYLQHPGSC